MIGKRLVKLWYALRCRRSAMALLRYRVLSSAEHRQIFGPHLLTIIDIGANRGQFALAARRWAPNADVIAFEPLPMPAKVFRSVFRGDDHVILHEVAVSSEAARREMHIAARDDSSSLLPIGALQSEMFPGTAEVGTIQVNSAPLGMFVMADDIRAPAMLKLDVQGFEYEALCGCESLLAGFDLIYCECSFVELYAGQKLAADVVTWLAARRFSLTGIFNAAYDRAGLPIQADFLFRRSGSL